MLLLDIGKHAAQKHDWVTVAVERMHIGSMMEFARFADFADSRMRLLIGNVYVIGYCSPSREHVHAVTVRLQGSLDWASQEDEVTLSIDAHAFTGTCDRSSWAEQTMSVVTDPLDLELPACQTGRKVVPRNKAVPYLDYSEYSTFIIATAVTITVLWVAFLMYLVIDKFWKCNGGWSRLPTLGF